MRPGKHTGVRTPSRAPSFQLTKHYLDVVTAAGGALIAYLSELRWKGLFLGHCAVLCRDEEGKSGAESVLRGVRWERLEPEVTSFRVRSLELSGTWRALQPEVERTLIEEQGGRLTWHCRHPLARAEVDYRGRRYQGLGYVEKLELTLPPWKLPIEELRWGRALFADRSVVWIDWRGPRSMRLVLLDGVEVEESQVEDRLVSGAGMWLGMEEPVVLREGPVVRTVLSEIPGLGGLLPRGFDLQETKWLSRAELRTGGPPRRGFAIHEVVGWR